MITKSQVKAAIKRIARRVESDLMHELNIKRKPRTRMERQLGEPKKPYSDDDCTEFHNKWYDRVYDAFDNWWSSEVGTGRIDRLGDYPKDETDIGYIQDAATIMQACIEEGYGVANDSGLLEGMAPFQALIAQAYHTMESAVALQEPRLLS